MFPKYGKMFSTVTFHFPNECKLKSTYMKNVLFALVIFSTLIACEEENVTRYSVDPRIDSYVTTFYDEAAERLITVDRNLVAEFKDIQGISKAETTHDQNYLYFNPMMFDGFKDEGLEAQIEAHVFYRLGGLLLKKDISEGVSFMNPDYMFTPYNEVNKEAMFDNLFE